MGSSQAGLILIAGLYLDGSQRWVVGDLYFKLLLPQKHILHMRNASCCWVERFSTQHAWVACSEDK